MENLGGDDAHRCTSHQFSTHQFLCIHGHFFQPPREEPFRGIILPEPGATPYENFNEKITAECYQPNAESGNFELISFDIGPTLAAWLEKHHPDIFHRILEADRTAWQRYGAGNTLAQAYNHTILPLATSLDKRTQIAWGLADYFHRFGHRADGMWLAETAVDEQTLELLAAQGVRYTILSPLQASEPVDPSEPYLVRLPSGRAITVFFYHAPLSTGVSFDDTFTSNADRFLDDFVLPQFNTEKSAQGVDQLVLVASDGELYGHHKPFRDQFLSHLIRVAAPRHGVQVVTLTSYLDAHPPTREAHLVTPSAWSCAHGVRRWSTGCSCTGGESEWKLRLRAALDAVSTRLDAIFEQRSSAALVDPWAARDAYILLRNGWMTADDFWESQGRHLRWLLHKDMPPQVAPLLLEAQYYGQAMFTSCGWFFEDLDRIEPRNDIAFARRAISLVWQATGIDLQSAFLADLALARSWRTARTGADLYFDLPAVAPNLLPPPQPVSLVSA